MRLNSSPACVGWETGSAATEESLILLFTLWVRRGPGMPAFMLSLPPLLILAKEAADEAEERNALMGLSPPSLYVTAAASPFSGATMGECAEVL